VGTNLAIFDIF